MMKARHTNALYGTSRRIPDSATITKPYNMHYLPLQESALSLYTQISSIPLIIKHRHTTIYIQLLLATSYNPTRTYF